MHTSSTAPTLPTPAGITPCLTLCGARRPAGGSDISPGPAQPPGPFSAAPAAIAAPEDEPVPPIKITRPYTLEPIVQQIQDTVTEMIEELERESNLEPEIAVHVFHTVAAIINDQYGPTVARRALRAILPGIQ